MSYHPQYVSCDTCKAPMHGINRCDPRINQGNVEIARNRCQNCGGNETCYNEANPNPKSPFAKVTENGEENR